MNDWKKIIERLNEQKMNPDLTEGEIEALEHRAKWIEILHREKPEKTKTVFYDAIQQRLEHGYSITTASLLRE